MVKRRITAGFFVLACALFVLLSGCCKSGKELNQAGGTENIRPPADNEGGYSTTPAQIEKVVAMAEALEANMLGQNLEKCSGKNWIAGISPHDAHLLAGRVYVHLFQKMRAKRFVIFGVAHKAADWEAQDAIILDNYNYWKGPYSPIKASRLREEIKESLPKEDYVVNDSWQAIEHSVEGILPFLQYYNRDAEIVSILVPYMDWPVIERISNDLAMALAGIIREHKWELGKDVAFIFSNDGNHYGDKDWGGKNSAPFGADETGYGKATVLDKDLIDRDLTGKVTGEKLKEFTSKVWGEKSLRDYKIRWCGRFAIPLGLYTVTLLTEKLNHRALNGYFLRYDTSVGLGKLPVEAGLETEAPYNLHHWVGYSAIGYY